jgi:hypothetical protein
MAKLSEAAAPAESSRTFSEVHAMAIALSLTQRPNDRSRAAVCQPFVTRTIQAV